jgi:hypothetical protein
MASEDYPKCMVCGRPLPYMIGGSGFAPCDCMTQSKTREELREEARRISAEVEEDLRLLKRAPLRPRRKSLFELVEEWWNRKGFGQ